MSSPTDEAITKALHKLGFEGSAQVSVTHNFTASGAVVLGGLVATGTADVVLKDLPSILTQVVVILGEKTEEGRLIEAVALPWFDIITLIKNDPPTIQQSRPNRLRRLGEPSQRIHRQWERLNGIVGKIGLSLVSSSIFLGIKTALGK